METIKQRTLKGSFSLFGKGLHTGLNLTVTFNPAPENHGYKIQRIDIDGQPTIDAIAEKVTDTQRGTVIASGDIRIGDTGKRPGIPYFGRIGHEICRENQRSGHCRSECTQGLLRYPQENRNQRRQDWVMYHYSSR